VGAYFSLKGTTGSGAFFFFWTPSEPNIEGAARMAAPVSAVLFMKFLLELFIIRRVK
jgi:hypothetical protein